MPFDLFLHHVAHHLGLAGDHHETHVDAEQHMPALVAPALTHSHWSTQALSSFLVPVENHQEADHPLATSAETSESLVAYPSTLRTPRTGVAHASAFLQAPFAKQRAHLRAKARFYHEAAVDFKRTILYRKIKFAVRRHFRRYGVVELFGAGLLAGSAVFLAIPPSKPRPKTPVQEAEAALKARRSSAKPRSTIQNEQGHNDDELPAGPGRISTSLALGAVQNSAPPAAQSKIQLSQAQRPRTSGQRHTSKRGATAGAPASEDSDHESADSA